MCLIEAFERLPSTARTSASFYLIAQSATLRRTKWRVMAPISITCASTTDRHRAALLAQGCIRLEVLAIADCSNITDAGLAAVVLTCRRLQQFVLVHAPLTTAVFTALIAQCTTPRLYPLEWTVSYGEDLYNKIPPTMAAKLRKVNISVSR